MQLVLITATADLGPERNLSSGAPRAGATDVQQQLTDCPSVTLPGLPGPLVTFSGWPVHFIEGSQGTKTVILVVCSVFFIHGDLWREQCLSHRV